MSTKHTLDYIAFMDYLIQVWKKLSTHENSFVKFRSTAPSYDFRIMELSPLTKWQATLETDSSFTKHSRPVSVICGLLPH